MWVRHEGGVALIGSPEGEGYASERPAREVRVPAFEMSQSEVTVAQYARCVQAGACDDEGLTRPDWGDAAQCSWGRPGRERHPLNCVSWLQANDFALWVGGRLPSEVEWAFAARGGASGREGEARRPRFPWGEEPATCERAVLRDAPRGDGCGLKGPAPVCSRPSGDTPLGLCDMLGNVWEWVMDEHHATFAGAPLSHAPWVTSPLERWREAPRVVRGVAFDDRDLPRLARRNHYPPSTRLASVGFRVARGRGRVIELHEP